MKHTHPLEPLVELYLAEKDITKGSYDLYAIILKQYMNYLKEHHITYAKTSDVINYREFKRSEGYSTQWIHHQIGAIKGFYKYLSTHQKRLNLPDVYAFDITDSIENEHIDQSISKPILSISQAKQFILSTKENRKYIWHYRDHAMIYLMITTGLRSVEIRRARIKDLKTLNQELVLYVQGKGRKSTDQFVKISKGVREAIDDYLGRRKDKNPYLFISHSKKTEIPFLSRTFFNAMFKRVLADAGLKNIKLTPHSLRHTAATINLLRGGTLDQTRKFMRHKDMSSTLIYAHHLEELGGNLERHLEDFILGKKVKQKKIDGG